MQDRYAGDVGDFGKFGMLRCMENTGLNVGVNWYLVDDESHNNDGKHIGYLQDERYRGVDDELLVSLSSMLEQGERTVVEIEKLTLLNTQKYYHERIIAPSTQVREARNEWHQRALRAMSGCDLVFLDPDNGMLPKSVSRGSCKSKKYVFPEEIKDYYENGNSVAFYSHRTREQLEVYLERFKELFTEAEHNGATIRGITFRKGTVRDYFFILHEEHRYQVEKGLENLLNGKWNQFFESIGILDKKVAEYEKPVLCEKNEENEEKEEDIKVQFLVENVNKMESTENIKENFSILRKIRGLLRFLIQGGK